jgi:hypothetical protein
MATATETPTFELILNEREVVFNMPTQGQLAQLRRMLSVAERVGNTDAETAVNAVARMVDIIIHMIKEPDDRAFVEYGLDTGTLDLSDMTAAMEAMGDYEPEPEAPKTGPVRKAAAKAPARRGSR